MDNNQKIFMLEVDIWRKSMREMELSQDPNQNLETSLQLLSQEGICEVCRL